MHTTNKVTSPDRTVCLAIRVDSARARMLYGTSCSAAGPWEGRFELAGGGDMYQHAEAWERGQFKWCDTALEAMVLADYEAACGFASQLLWDLYASERGEEGHVVLSARPWPRGE